MSQIMQTGMQLLTIRQAAEMINVHPNTLRNWEKAGKIQAVRIGSRKDRRYTKDALEQVFSTEVLPFQLI